MITINQWFKYKYGISMTEYYSVKIQGYDKKNVEELQRNLFNLINVNNFDINFSKEILKSAVDFVYSITGTSESSHNNYRARFTNFLMSNMDIAFDIAKSNNLLDGIESKFHDLIVSRSRELCDIKVCCKNMKDLELFCKFYDSTNQSNNGRSLYKEYITRYHKLTGVKNTNYIDKLSELQDLVINYIESEIY